LEAEWVEQVEGVLDERLVGERDEGFVAAHAGGLASGEDEGGGGGGWVRVRGG
jgi:hypothetical protein